jgi:signal transduction histidine kinase
LERPISAPSAVPSRLYRRLDRRLLAGVASGIAAHLGVSVTAVRIGFVVLLGFNGLGAILYAVFWAVLPVQPGQVKAPRRDLSHVLPFVAIAAGILLLQSLVGWGGVNAGLFWLIAIIGVGAGVIWHQTSPARRQERSTSHVPPVLGQVLVESDRRGYLLRFLGGGLLVTVGVIGIIVAFSPVRDAGLSAIFTGAVIGFASLLGVALVASPMLWRTFGQLRTEREARIREQERAEVAAMVHDQVLHTLALVQRNAGDPRAVQRLARGQERMLRNWLYKPAGSPSEKFSAALEEVAAEVEDTYAIAVETVMVGDLAVDGRVGALVAATREALVNAARHAKVPSVSLYAEVEPEKLSVFVRDRGIGFDPSTVEDNRHGVRGSILGRMQRHGGHAEIRSEPGEGTEVRLTLPVKEES